MSGVHEYEDFRANCDHMPGRGRKLKVGGTVVFRQGGWSARLEAREGNQGINDKLLHLNLVIDPAEYGPDLITHFPLDEYQIDDPPIEYDQVEFHVVGSDDDPPEILEVEHPTRQQ